MKKRITNYLVILLSSIVGLTIAFYFVVAFSYREGFTYGTYINGVYCTGKTIGEVNSELIKREDIGQIKVSSDYSEDEFIDLNAIDYKVDYEKSLNLLYEKQNPFLWFLNIANVYVNKYVKPDVSYDHDKLVYEVSNLSLVHEYDPKKDYEIKIVYGQKGYELINTFEKSIDVESILPLFESKVITKENVEVQKDLFYYRDNSLQEIETLRLWDDLSKYLETKIVYDMGSELIPIDGKVLSDFLVVENGEFVREEENFKVNEEKIKQFVDDICDVYYTYKQPRDYISFRGELKHLNLSTYGTEINKVAEEEYLINAIKNKTIEKHIPSYIHQGYVRGLNDIGPEFIEIDLTNQKLFYIKDGVILMDTDIVSGYPNAENATPPMMCYVYKKARNAVLVGENYRSKVDYWMAIYKAIGLHDAKWQAKFGGDRYKRYGSHGCINMITEDAASLYEQISVGIPVIVYK